MKTLSIAAAITFGSLSLTSHADTITLATDVWFPMSGQPNSDKPGYMIEIAEKALAMQQYKMNYKLMPWLRAIDAARKGDINCIVGAHVEDAPDFVFGKQNYGSDAAHFFTNTNSPWSYTGPDSLAGKKVGTIVGYAYDPSVDSWLESNAIALGGDDALPKNIKKLSAKRLDTVIEFSMVMQAKLQEMGMAGKIKSAGAVSEPSGLYIACSPNLSNSSAVVTALDEGLAALRASGELAKIMAKYGLTDWQ